MKVPLEVYGTTTVFVEHSFRLQVKTNRKLCCIHCNSLSHGKTSCHQQTIAKPTGNHLSTDLTRARSGKERASNPHLIVLQKDINGNNEFIVPKKTARNVAQTLHPDTAINSSLKTNPFDVLQQLM